ILIRTYVRATEGEWTDTGGGSEAAPGGTWLCAQDLRQRGQARRRRVTLPRPAARDVPDRRSLAPPRQSQETAVAGGLEGQPLRAMRHLRMARCTTVPGPAPHQRQ